MLLDGKTVFLKYMKKKSIEPEHDSVSSLYAQPWSLYDVCIIVLLQYI